jgi:hypothetical protein
VRGLKCFDGVKSLNDRGNFFRGGTGRLDFSFVIGDLTLTAATRSASLIFAVLVRAPDLSSRRLDALTNRY